MSENGETIQSPQTLTFEPLGYLANHPSNDDTDELQPVGSYVNELTTNIIKDASETIGRKHDDNSNHTELDNTNDLNSPQISKQNQFETTPTNLEKSEDSTTNGLHDEYDFDNEDIQKKMNNVISDIQSQSINEKNPSRKSTISNNVYDDQRNNSVPTTVDPLADNTTEVPIRSRSQSGLVDNNHISNDQTSSVRVRDNENTQDTDDMFGIKPTSTNTNSTIDDLLAQNESEQNNRTNNRLDDNDDFFNTKVATINDNQQHSTNRNKQNNLDETTNFGTTTSSRVQSATSKQSVRLTPDAPSTSPDEKRTETSPSKIPDDTGNDTDRDNQEVAVIARRPSRAMSPVNRPRSPTPNDSRKVSISQEPPVTATYYTEQISRDTVDNDTNRSPSLTDDNREKQVTESSGSRRASINKMNNEDETNRPISAFPTKTDENTYQGPRSRASSSRTSQFVTTGEQMQTPTNDFDNESTNNSPTAVQSLLLVNPLLGSSLVQKEQDQTQSPTDIDRKSPTTSMISNEKVIDGDILPSRSRRESNVSQQQMTTIDQKPTSRHGSQVVEQPVVFPRSRRGSNFHEDELDSQQDQPVADRRTSNVSQEPISHRRSLVAEQASTNRRVSTTDEQTPTSRKESSASQQQISTSKRPSLVADQDTSNRRESTTNEQTITSRKDSTASQQQPSSKRSSVASQQQISKQRESPTNEQIITSRKSSSVSASVPQPPSRRESTASQQHMSNDRASISDETHVVSRKGSTVSEAKVPSRRESAADEQKSPSRKASAASGQQPSSKRSSFAQEQSAVVRRESTADEQKATSRKQSTVSEQRPPSKRSSIAPEDQISNRRESTNGESKVASRKSTMNVEEQVTNRRESAYEEPKSHSRKSSTVSERQASGRQETPVQEQSSSNRRDSFFDQQEPTSSSKAASRKSSVVEQQQPLSSRRDSNQQPPTSRRTSTNRDNQATSPHSSSNVQTPAAPVLSRRGSITRQSQLPSPVVVRRDSRSSVDMVDTNNSQTKRESSSSHKQVHSPDTDNVSNTAEVTHTKIRKLSSNNQQKAASTNDENDHRRTSFQQRSAQEAKRDSNINTDQTTVTPIIKDPPKSRYYNGHRTPTTESSYDQGPASKLPLVSSSIQQEKPRFVETNNTQQMSVTNQTAYRRLASSPSEDEQAPHWTKQIPVPTIRLTDDEFTSPRDDQTRPQSPNAQQIAQRNQSSLSPSPSTKKLGGKQRNLADGQKQKQQHHGSRRSTSADTTTHIQMVDDKSLDSTSENNGEVYRHKRPRIKPTKVDVQTNTDQIYESPAQQRRSFFDDKELSPRRPLKATKPPDQSYGIRRRAGDKEQILTTPDTIPDTDTSTVRRKVKQVKDSKVDKDPVHVNVTVVVKKFAGTSKDGTAHTTAEAFVEQKPQQYFESVRRPSEILPPQTSTTPPATANVDNKEKSDDVIDRPKSTQNEQIKSAEDNNFQHSERFTQSDTEQIITNEQKKRRRPKRISRTCQTYEAVFRRMARDQQQELRATSDTEKNIQTRKSQLRSRRKSPKRHHPVYLSADTFQLEELLPKQHHQSRRNMSKSSSLARSLSPQGGKLLILRPTLPFHHTDAVNVHRVCLQYAIDLVPNDNASSGTGANQRNRLTVLKQSENTNNLPMISSSSSGMHIPTNRPHIKEKSASNKSEEYTHQRKHGGAV